MTRFNIIEFDKMLQRLMMHTMVRCRQRGSKPVYKSAKSLIVAVAIMVLRTAKGQPVTRHLDSNRQKKSSEWYDY